MVNMHGGLDEKNQRHDAVVGKNDVVKRRPEVDRLWSVQADRYHRQQAGEPHQLLQHVVL